MANPSLDITQNPAPTPDAKHTIAFLERFHGQHHWTLSSIVPDGGIHTQTFTTEQRAEAVDFVQSCMGEKNLYFHVNPSKEPKNAKLKREDIACVLYLHVDVDPEKGCNVEEERQRIFALLQNPPTDIPQPTVIVDSGGGYQAYWKLREPLKMEDAAAIEEATAYNRWLAQQLGGDHCFSIDHLMRLPHTINIPNAKKREAGRVEAVSSVVLFDESRVYELNQFQRATKQTLPRTTATVSLQDLQPLPLDGLDKLPNSVNKKIRMLIEKGRLENDKKGKTRSEAVFAVIKELLKAKVEEGTILWILTNPDYGISASILEKPYPTTHAIGEIERAIEKGVIILDTPQLHTLNERHAVIADYGGKCKIVTLTNNPQTGRQDMTIQDFSDFEKRYMHHRMEYTNADGEHVSMPLGKYWLHWENRRQYERLVYSPNTDLPNTLNLWRGYAVDPAQGDWSLMSRHIREVLANDDPISEAYILKWVAWLLQNPDERAEVAVVFMGGRGTGKGIFGNALCDIFGPHGLRVDSSEHLTGRFNNHLRNLSFIFADEAYLPSEKRAESRLKAMITEPTLSIEAKGVDTVSVKNHLHVMMASNDEWVVPAGSDERRFAVFQVSSRYQQQHEAYFKPLAEQTANGGLAAMLYDMLEMDLGDWHPRKDIPQTQALMEQKIAGLSAIAAVFLDSLRTGIVMGESLEDEIRVPKGREHHDKGLKLSTAAFQQHIKKEIRGERVTLNQVAKFFEKTMGFAKYEGRPRGYSIPPLLKARERWNLRMFPVAWDTDITSWYFFEES